ncbi:MAG: hypothetical protein KGS72_25635 [Cyanobacteria bacterium REEB67]|nr:hypothetical protein [Cyanobacteria bacterium REEB67]
MQSIHKHPGHPIPIYLTIIIILACLAVLFFATRQSASKTMKPIPTNGLEDLALKQGASVRP